MATTRSLALGLVIWSGLLGLAAPAASSRPGLAWAVPPGSTLGGQQVGSSAGRAGLSRSGPRLPAGRPRSAASRRPLGVVARLGKERRSNIDYYALLGVGRGADIHQIKAAYRKLALEFHPDINKAKDAQEKFVLVSEAYAVLVENEAARQTSMWGDTPVQAFKRQKKFRLGEVVSHKKMDYIAVVVAVDEMCGASEEWMKKHRVDALPRGRTQRFYHLLPDIPEDEHLDASQSAVILDDSPAFLFYKTEECQWPDLVTTYVAEDLLAPYVRKVGSESEITGEGPIQNPILPDLFTGYTRGRYTHNGDLSANRFTPVSQTMILLSLYKFDKIRQPTSPEAVQPINKPEQTKLTTAVSALLVVDVILRALFLDSLVASIASYPYKFSVLRALVGVKRVVGLGKVTSTAS